MTQSLLSFLRWATDRVSPLRVLMRERRPWPGVPTPSNVAWNIDGLGSGLSKRTLPSLATAAAGLRSAWSGPVATESVKARGAAAGVGSFSWLSLTLLTSDRPILDRRDWRLMGRFDWREAGRSCLLDGRSRSSLWREAGKTNRLRPPDGSPLSLRRTDGVGERERLRFWKKRSEMLNVKGEVDRIDDDGPADDRAGSSAPDEGKG